MKKSMICLLAAALLAASSLTGCESTLRKSIETTRLDETLKELDPETFFDEESGYHYPVLPWGISATDAYTALDEKITGVSSYDDEGNTAYTVEDLYITIQGREVDAVSLTAAENAEVVNFSIAMQQDGMDETDIPQSELYAEYRETLIAALGQPSEEKEEERTLAAGIQGTVQSCYWRYTTPDGKETELQWASMTMDGDSDATYLTLGFVWTNQKG